VAKEASGTPVHPS